MPEQLALVFIVDSQSVALGCLRFEAQVGGFAVLIAALVGTLLVIPTGGEIPIILACRRSDGRGRDRRTADRASGTEHSLDGHGRKVLGWRTTTAMGTAVALGGVLSGAVLVLGS
ncbi:hypothetical protein [Brevibacterium aurantiacum]|uniref:hypothetical protein n=1 Tax=Brevibacterium aurantiacum TaxID=273384 RepID=UPI000F639D74|nr:hypothetical protein [Brevibacterium aurantiacum]AZL05101.1 hypothetical protein CXR24_05420 [Brevibacterium aurantiacum]